MSPADAVGVLEKIPAPVWQLIWKTIVYVLAGKPDKAALHARAAALRSLAKQAVRAPVKAVPR